MPILCWEKGVYWSKDNRKWKWDEDLCKTDTRSMGFLHLNNGTWSKFGLENRTTPTLSEPCVYDKTM